MRCRELIENLEARVVLKALKERIHLPIIQSCRRSKQPAENAL